MALAHYRLRVQATAGLPATPWEPTGHVRITLTGQSNAVGYALRSDLSASPLSADSGLATYNSVAFGRVYIWSVSSGAYVQLQNGVNGLATDSTRFGPEFGLAVRWMREVATHDLYIDKVALGGQRIANFQAGQTLYTDEQSVRSNADAWLTTNSKTITQEAWIWVQGEADDDALAGTYLTALNTLTSSRISDGLIGASDKRLIAQMAPGSDLYSANVEADKVSYQASNSSTTTLIDMTGGLQADNVHLNGRGMVQFGYDCFAALFGADTTEAPT